MRNDAKIHRNMVYRSNQSLATLLIFCWPSRNLERDYFLLYCLFYRIQGNNRTAFGIDLWVTITGWKVNNAQCEEKVWNPKINQLGLFSMDSIARERTEHGDQASRVSNWANWSTIVCGSLSRRRFEIPFARSFPNIFWCSFPHLERLSPSEDISI